MNLIIPLLTISKIYKLKIISKKLEFNYSQALPLKSNSTKNIIENTNLEVIANLNKSEKLSNI